jgi:transketolase
LITTWNLPSPVYYRLGKDEKTVVPGLEGEFEIGKAQMVRKGEEILFISMGSVTIEVVSAIDELAQKGISCGLAIVSCFNPSPIDDVAEIISHYALTISVEEHYITGGLGSLVAEVIAEKSLECRLIRCGLRDNPDGITGTHKFMLSHYGLSQDALVSMVLKQKMVENV